MSVNSLLKYSVVALLVCLGANPAVAGDELVFRDLHLRLIRVEENDPNNTRDDVAVITARTATNSANLRITEYTSAFLDEYEIYVMYVQPDSTRRGGGTARITAYGP